MSLRQLETLVAIADAGSFNGAADRLGITQSAVSMQMKALEADLGTSLFDRSRRPPGLREAAAPQVERARQILRLYRDFQLGVQAAGTLAGSLRIGVIPTVSTGILPDALALLRRRTPGLQVRIENELSTELIRRVERGLLDAAILTEPPRLNAGLSGRTILRERLLVVAPADSAGETDREVLTAQPFVRFNRRAGVGRVIDAALRERRIEVVERMELDSIESILMMVSRGLGATIAPERSISPEQRGALKCLPFGDPPLYRRVALVERGDVDRSALTDALYDALTEVAGRDGA